MWAGLAAVFDVWYPYIRVIPLYQAPVSLTGVASLSDMQHLQKWQIKDKDCTCWGLWQFGRSVSSVACFGADTMGQILTKKEKEGKKKKNTAWNSRATIEPGNHNIPAYTAPLCNNQVAKAVWASFTTRERMTGHSVFFQSFDSALHIIWWTLLYCLFTDKSCILMEGFE